MGKSVFKIFKRCSCEKTHKIRREGQVPGIIYGEFLNENIPIKIENGILSKLLRSNTTGSIISLSLNDKTINCVVKDIQKDNFGRVIHIDFQGVKDHEVIKMKVPVNFLGGQGLEAKNLILEILDSNIEFHGMVEKIPEYIEIDVSNMGFEDKIYAKDIKIPNGVELVTNPETLLAVVNA